MKDQLSISSLIQTAKKFAEIESKFSNSELFGISDGKAIGTYVEHKFKRYLETKYITEFGSSSNGIDLPSSEIQTDIKVTSIKQPQSSCPFKSAEQKIYGLGYNILLFVYDKIDNTQSKSSIIKFLNCSFIAKERTADFTTTFRLIEMIKDKANEEDIASYLLDKNLPADEIVMSKLVKRILETPPIQGYLTISNALQWRLQYQRIVNIQESIDGIVKII